MISLSSMAIKYPLLSFVLLTYSITWGVWLSVPILTGADWALLKIFLGIGMGPGLAALIIDYLQNKHTIIISRQWAIAFIPIFILLTLLNVSSLITGNASTPTKFATTTAPDLSLIGVLGSMLAASICAFIFASSMTSQNRHFHKIIAWRISARWWCFALFVPSVFHLLGTIFLWATTQDMSILLTPDLTVSDWLFYSARAMLYTLFIVAVGEEVGWRGYMLPKLMQRYSLLMSSVILGLIWGGWHLPLFFNGFYSHSPESIIGYLLIGPIYAILFTWFYIKTDGNLLLIIVLHTMMNSTALFLAPSPSTALIILFTITLVITEKMWRKP